MSSAANLRTKKPRRGLRHQQPLLLQQPRGLAHRRPADAEFPGNPRFHHFGTRRQPALNDGLGQNAGDLADQIGVGKGR